MMTVPLERPRAEFDALVSADPVRYHSFLVAGIRGGEVHLAVDGGIEGMMVVSEGRAEIDGSDAAVRELFDLLPEGEWSLSVPIGTLRTLGRCRRGSDDIILRLGLLPGVEMPEPEHPVGCLGEGDAVEISAPINSANSPGLTLDRCS